ncbi:hypothetical protein AB1Y20_003710 [Prymnesium parvum]|uniref:C2H2-type domain-containing protein n=1 Tax=Prymnesium parvum TaxID=97485 RepID=A0AB34J603_PRYPA
MGVLQLFQVLFILPLQGATEAHAQDHEHPALLCNRAAAREARKEVRDMLIPLVKSYGARMSPVCPLHKEHDRLLGHESQKKALTISNWRCEICGKSFRSEHYIDMHLDRKHLDTLPHTATTCLGDFCDILRCPGWVNGVKARLRENPADCDERELEARRHYCQHLMHDCFAHLNETGHALFESLDSQLCSALTCKWQLQLRDGKAVPPVVHAQVPLDRNSLGSTILAVVLLLVLGGLYCGVYCWYRDTKIGRGDLKARSNRRGGVSWFKSKAY